MQIHSFFLTDDIIFSLIKNATFFENVLSPLELKNFSTQKSLKRQRQFFSGRYITKISILQKTLSYNFSEINISNLTSGEPFFNNEFFISISHSNNIAASVVFLQEHSLGVDVEFFDEKIFKLKKFIEPCFSENIEQFTISMSIKEALSKALGVGFTLPIKTFTIKNIFFDEMFIAEFENYQDYIGYAILKDQFVISFAIKKTIKLPYTILKSKLDTI